MDETIDTKIQELAEKTIEKHVAGGFTKALLMLGVSVGIWWLRRELSKKEKELADARLKADTDRLDAEKAAHLAKQATLEEMRTRLEKAADAALQRAEANAARLRTREELHQEQLKKLQAIEENDWLTINKLAGVE